MRYAFPFPARLPRPAGAVGMLVLAASLFGACAPPAAGGPLPAGVTRRSETFVVSVRDQRTYEEVINLPVERVWAAIPQAFSDLNFPGGPSTKAGERLFLTPHMHIKSRLYDHVPNSKFIECGRTAEGMAASDSYSVTFAILMWAHPQPSGGTKVEVLIDGKAIQRGTSSNFVPCTGTGALERELVQALHARLGSKAG